MDDTGIMVKDAVMDIPSIGELLRVTVGTPEKQDAKWLEKGDIVEVVGIYDHIFMVQKLKEGKDGFHMRQCYPRSSWWLNLERLG